MNTRKRMILVALCGGLLATLTPWSVRAEDGLSQEEIAQANNPLADFQTFNINNYYIPDIYGVPDETANTMWFRYAGTAGPLLYRVSAPFKTVPRPGMDPEVGLGDVDLFVSYTFRTPTFTFGLGPQVYFPTATEDMLGTNRWSLGGAAVFFWFGSRIVQFGSLVTYVHSVDESGGYDTVSSLAVQVFPIFQLGGGTYLRSVPIWSFNLETGDYSIPVGLGIGRVIRTPKVILNIFVEPQYTVLHHGVGQPAFQVYIGFNSQLVPSRD